MNYRLGAALLALSLLWSTPAQALYETPQFAENDKTMTRGEMLLSLVDYFDIQVSPEAAAGKEQNILYFSDVLPSDPRYGIIATLCRRQTITCDASRTLNDKEPASIESTLKVFYELQYEEPGFIPKKYGNPDGTWYLPYTVEAVKEGLIAREKATGVMTHKGLHLLLKKDALRRAYNKEISFFDGLLANASQISATEYHDLPRLERILQGYALAQTTPQISRDVASKLAQNAAAFRTLYEEIKAQPLQYDPAYTAEWKAKFREAGIKEELGVGSYRFKTNEAYRKKNIVGTLEKMSGLVLQPGEEFNYWKVLEKIGTKHIVSGWTLQGSSAVWAWGGGLCGSATALFRAAWFSGLEITDRRPHSVYTTGYYPMKDIGLDASIFMPAPNFKFRNDIGAPVMLYVTYSDEPGYGTIKIQVLGTKNFETMTFPDLKRAGGYYIRERVLKFLDGTERTDEVKSSYRRIH